MSVRRGLSFSIGDNTVEILPRPTSWLAVITEYNDDGVAAGRKYLTGDDITQFIPTVVTTAKEFGEYNSRRENRGEHMDEAGERSYAVSELNPSTAIHLRNLVEQCPRCWGHGFVAENTMDSEERTLATTVHSPADRLVQRKTSGRDVMCPVCFGTGYTLTVTAKAILDLVLMCYGPRPSTTTKKHFNGLSCPSCGGKMTDIQNKVTSDSYVRTDCSQCGFKGLRNLIAD